MVKNNIMLKILLTKLKCLIDLPLLTLFSKKYFFFQMFRCLYMVLQRNINKF